MEKVDILLPIYNSLDETKNCIKSILMWTSPERYNLYLLDDNSPDGQIQKMTKFYSEKYQNIISIRNEKNLGFPGNVNNGFLISENDVIILNSDTLVTANWLETMVMAANSDDAIAAVIPMSNYGIISGVPTPNSSINNLFSFEEIFSAFQECKEAGYIESPLLTGFCMYMKRGALNKVGIFDAETFQRGYGEETDWCMRARQKGYKLVVAKGAYVHHTGGSSFGAEKEVLQKRSKEILLKRYPQIDADLEKFVKGNYFKKMRKNMMRILPFLGKGSGTILKLRMIKHYIANSL